MPGKLDLLKNTFNVREISFTEKIQHMCPLGDQIGLTTYTVTVEPGTQLAEFCSLHNEIQKMIGRPYTIESGAQEVLNIVKRHYEDAEAIEVVASCEPNKHMPVKVTLFYEKEDF